MPAYLNSSLRSKWQHGLKQYGLTVEEAMASWKYAGGDTGRHLSYYLVCFKRRPPPAPKNHCVCGHHIKEQCYITDFLSVGNGCVEKSVLKKGAGL